MLHRKIIPQTEQGIPDARVYGAVRAGARPRIRDGLLERRRGKIGVRQAGRAASLNVAEDCIADLDFLRFFPKLKVLNVRSRALRDLAGLEFVPALESLSLMSAWPGGMDLTPAAACASLKELDICRRREARGPLNCRGWEHLSRLDRLETLGLPNLGLGDLWWIAHMPRLSDVELAGNPLQDLEALRGHPGITDLDLTGCGITDISVLATLPNLRHLELDGNPIRDFSPLTGLPRLEYLSADGLTRKEQAQWRRRLPHTEVDFEPLN